MPKGVIAVEPGLSPVSDFLRGQGYRVVALDQAGLQDVDAIVVRGTDDNLTGAQDILGRAPVIEAAGRTPEEVGREVENRIR